MKITIGAQYGDSASDKKVHPIKRNLTDCLTNSLQGEYFQKIEEIGLVLRTSGSIWKFEPPGVSKVRHSSKHNSITADIVIAESEWKNQTTDEIKTTIAKYIRECFLLILERAEKNKEITSKERYLNDLSAGLDDFLSPKNPQPTIENT
ncbi:hypothetical protein [Pseudomonas sp. B21-031]|uniref:hypothetical protein n=1 Tax=Pseudomonas sp. B21-031 TaxID=2895482 RepID=UPI00215F81C6|nr:hypothetical protein [Pseudomonas sp. B21-031]UVL64788.1 hypothetical protein LOY53_15235 [Pseudomonas sp. B21-031]